MSSSRSEIILQWSIKFFHKWTTCNPTYRKTDLMIADIQRAIEAFLSLQPAIRVPEQLIHELIHISSGLDRDFSADCFVAYLNKERRQAAMEKSLSKLLREIS